MDCHRPVNAELYEVKWKKEPPETAMCPLGCPIKTPHSPANLKLACERSQLPPYSGDAAT